MKIPPSRTLYEHPMATFWFDEEGILHSISKAGPRDLGTMKNYIAFVKKMVNDRPVCILTDISLAGPMDKEVRDYSSVQMQAVYKAMAILSDSAMGSMIGKVFLQLESQSYPIRMFAKEEDAREWLRQYL